MKPKCKICGSENVYVDGFRGRGIRVPGGVCMKCRERENAELATLKHSITEKTLKERIAKLRTMPSFDFKDEKSIEKFALPLIRSGFTSIDDWEKNAPMGWIGRDFFLFEMLVNP